MIIMSTTVKRYLIARYREGRQEGRDRNFMLEFQGGHTPQRIPTPTVTC